MTIQTIALAGANSFIGKEFAKEFIAQGHKLRILVRAESIESALLQELKSKGASLHVVSYNKEPSLVDALRGADVLVSAVGLLAVIAAQLPLIKAAKVAGVKLLNHPSSMIQSEKKVIKAAQDAGLPYTALHNGGFPEYCLSPPFGWNFPKKKVTVWGDGNARSTWTTAHSVADWLANVLRTVPLSELENKYLLIQGNVATTNEIIKMWEQKHNTKLEVEYRPAKELDDRVDANAEDIFAVLLQDWASGRPFSNRQAPNSDQVFVRHLLAKAWLGFPAVLLPKHIDIETRALALSLTAQRKGTWLFATGGDSPRLACTQGHSKPWPIVPRTCPYDQEHQSKVWIEHATTFRARHPPSAPEQWILLHPGSSSKFDIIHLTVKSPMVALAQNLTTTRSSSAVYFQAMQAVVA
ncbi:NmrA-like family domain-containing protein 1 [Rhizoctonia solani]|uniref:NmrA-like family domain-containing protein 1 n=1 Tax=Rhizoctonia solani TaxID=456999 RepID=A0A8H8T1H5_9AGAM|nr:NmrA-like family domain-containing protein 1 [Rhizoctonia solani]QRW25829.1 NmrA-like family domain-containing protein 1 [Rhizoctonia solani]